MGAAACGVMNTKSFEEAIKTSFKFPLSAIGYQGVLNEQYYPIKTKEEEKLLTCELGYAMVENPFNSKKEYYVSSILKSKYDGVGFRRPMDIMIVLDISGSMGNYMSSVISNNHKTIDVAKEAIFAINKALGPEDQIGLVLFDNLVETALPLMPPVEEDLLKDILQPIKPRGGTDLLLGLNQGVDEMKRNMRIGSYHRIFFLTDLCNTTNDQNLPEFEKLLHNISIETSPIYTSIIGLGRHLDSSYMEICSKNKGSSSFSAINDTDLKEILYTNFSYNFFPYAENIQLTFRSGNFIIKKHYGTSTKEVEIEDKNQIKITKTPQCLDKEFRDHAEFLLLYFQRINRKLPLSVLKNLCDFKRFSKESVLSINSLIPSPLKEEENKLPQIKGGLVLLKVIPQRYQVDSQAEMVMYGNDLEGRLFYEKKHLHFDMNNGECGDYFNHKGIQKGIALYYYAKYIRKFVKASSRTAKGDAPTTAFNLQSTVLTHPQMSYVKYEELIAMKPRVIDFLQRNLNESKNTIQKYINNIEGAIKCYQPKYNN